MKKLCTTGAIVAVCLCLASCATNPQNQQDPYENINRSIYTFNKKLDKYLLKPVAKGYDYILPDAVKDRVSDFFGNINDVTTAANSLLQGKFAEAGKDSSRILINTTVGIGGLFDVASRAGIMKGDEDFGQTLGAWGVDSGPYLMIPFLGPATLRGAVGDVVDGYALDVKDVIDHVPTRNTLRGVEIVDKRYQLFPLESSLEDAIDEYAFVRDAYLQRRNYLVHDGDVPLDDDDEFWDDCEDEDCEEEELDEEQ